jgi:hypothetical protein
MEGKERGGAGLCRERSGAERRVAGGVGRVGGRVLRGGRDRGRRLGKDLARWGPREDGPGGRRERKGREHARVV